MLEGRFFCLLLGCFDMHNVCVDQFLVDQTLVTCSSGIDINTTPASIQAAHHERIGIQLIQQTLVDCFTYLFMEMTLVTKRYDVLE